ncbi:uncharacterized protein BCR38DRAFT_410429 [Pseudomassariella vexata]|uniref:Peptidoglycan binding-like domain-containing protein n=1 Tax=Pseudomassariella vexata TaxID=1141098 RepID=A0A1Y2DW50_9PEZI|nr:uncharacterized protein BCR38DRAFT_410429 [Pseudomassariella vexata]ORY63522.1 hypothetical protein BCR38DRAFT_410429 [Pseudomassariella vexata]
MKSSNPLVLLITLLTTQTYTTLAASGYCNTVVSTKSGAYTISYPAYSSGGSTTKDCIMNEGAAGSGVKSVQVAYNHCYGSGLAEDGDYGPNTKAAVKTIQRGIGGLDIDGIYGPKTGAKMNYWGVHSSGSHWCVSI